MEVNVDHFRERIGEHFKIEFNPDSTLSACLTEVSVLGKKFNQEVEAFALIFETDQCDQYFTQSIVRIYLNDVSTLEVFVSPKGLSNQTGKMMYEVIFN